jgi:hypothetical protein
MTIAEYLTELDRELRRRRAPRARLLRETEDHLRDLCSELSGDEARAVQQFGAVAAIAGRFATATASTTAHRAVTLTAVGFTAYAGVFVAFATTASPLLRDFPQGAGSFLALQLAAVAVAIAFVRSWRWRREPAAPAAELRAIARAVSIAGVALMGAALAEVAAAVSRPAGVIAWSHGRWLTLAFAGVLAVLLLSAVAAVRAAAKAQAVDSLPGRRSVTLLAEDIEALLPQFSRTARALLAHAWPTTLALAALAFVAVTAVGLAGSGRAGLGGAMALAAVEASLIVLSFAGFGRALGLRDPLQQR